MSRIEELKKFAQEQEQEARGKLDRIRGDIEKKRITCNGVKKQEFTTNLNDILAFYDEQLINIDDAAGKLNLILPLDLNNVELDENVSIEEYKGKISAGYDNVILQFENTSRGIIRFCRILIDITDQNRTADYGLFGKVYVLVNILVKFILPLQSISKILNECGEQASYFSTTVLIRDEPPTNPNDDNHKEEASEQLKRLAQSLIEKDNKIKLSFNRLLETIIDGFALSDTFRSDFYGFMKDYYRLNMDCGTIHLELCAYKMDNANQVSSAQISDYHKEINHLKAGLQDSFNSAIDQISHFLKN